MNFSWSLLIIFMTQHLIDLNLTLMFEIQMIPLISIFIVNELEAIWTKQIEATLIFDVHIFSS